MRSVTRACLPILTLILTGFMPLMFPLSVYADQGGYLLLELDGHKVKWGDRQFGVPASISYAFAREALWFDDARNCGDMAPIEGLLGETLAGEALVHETAAAFQVWERAAGLSFHKVADANEADIVIGAQGQPRGRAFANVSYEPDSQDGVRAIKQALVCLNPELVWKVGFDGNEEIYDIRYTLIHEIGHAIGLDHPGASGQVMAFRYTEAFADLQPGDLRGVQLLYGRAVADSVSKVTDARLTRKPNEGHSDDNLIGYSVVRREENEMVEASSDLIIYRGDSIVAEILAAFPAFGELGIGEETVFLP